MSKSPHKNSLAVVILAAGKGTRMKGLSGGNRPKAMHTLAGKPMISWLLESVQALEPEKLVVVVAPGMKILEDEVAPHMVAIQAEQKGTADAVSAALPALEGFEGDVLVLLGDTPLIKTQTLRSLIEKRRENNAGLAVLGMTLEDPFGYGRLILNENGTLLQIVEEKDADEKQRAVQSVNTGAFCMNGEKFRDWLEQIGNENAQGEFYITDLPEIAAFDGYVTAVHITNDIAEVQGCNTPTELAALEKTAQQRLRERLMNEGVKMIDPDTVYLHHDTKIAPGVIVEPNVFFGSEVEVAGGVHIKAFCHIEGARIGENTTVGPFARLRPGAEIGEDVRIGNFVEIKKSEIGAGSKINHLAYVGDCLMGPETNFSAGAITVNYDGFDKHRTVIGEGVMVGSNVNLVAPVNIADGAFIAAGSTITKDVPADALAVAREGARIHEGWAAKYRDDKQAAKPKKKAS